jgi:hypothetical protein
MACGCGGWVRPGVRAVFHPVRVQQGKVAVGGGNAYDADCGRPPRRFSRPRRRGRPRGTPPAASRVGVAGGRGPNVFSRDVSHHQAPYKRWYYSVSAVGGTDFRTAGGGVMPRGSRPRASSAISSFGLSYDPNERVSEWACPVFEKPEFFSATYEC